jgi:hypothetical protein
VFEEQRALNIIEAHRATISSLHHTAEDALGSLPDWPGLSVPQPEHKRVPPAGTQGRVVLAHPNLAANLRKLDLSESLANIHHFWTIFLNSLNLPA